MSLGIGTPQAAARALNHIHTYVCMCRYRALIVVSREPRALGFLRSPR